MLRDFKKNDWERELSDIKEEKEDLDNKHEKLSTKCGIRNEKITRKRNKKFN